MRTAIIGLIATTSAIAIGCSSEQASAKIHCKANPLHPACCPSPCPVQDNQHSADLDGQRRAEDDETELLTDQLGNWSAIMNRTQAPATYSLWAPAQTIGGLAPDPATTSKGQGYAWTPKGTVAGQADANRHAGTISSLNNLSAYAAAVGNGQKRAALGGAAYTSALAPQAPTLNGAIAQTNEATRAQTVPMVLQGGLMSYMVQDKASRSGFRASSNDITPPAPIAIVGLKDIPEYGRLTAKQTANAAINRANAVESIDVNNAVQALYDEYIDNYNAAVARNQADADAVRQIAASLFEPSADAANRILAKLNSVGLPNWYDNAGSESVRIAAAEQIAMDINSNPQLYGPVKPAGDPSNPSATPQCGESCVEGLKAFLLSRGEAETRKPEADLAVAGKQELAEFNGSLIARYNLATTREANVAAVQGDLATAQTQLDSAFFTLKSDGDYISLSQKITNLSAYFAQ